MLFDAKLVHLVQKSFSQVLRIRIPDSSFSPRLSALSFKVVLTFIESELEIELNSSMAKLNRSPSKNRFFRITLIICWTIWAFLFDDCSQSARWLRKLKFEKTKKSLDLFWIYERIQSHPIEQNGPDCNVFDFIYAFSLVCKLVERLCFCFYFLDLKFRLS